MTVDDAVNFAGLGLRAELLSVLTELGYEEPTPIQSETIPAFLEGHDLLGQAATGTGKTAAFALPLLQRMGTRDRLAKEPVALVLVPTRELAMQVSEAIHRYGRSLGTRVVPVYGGQPIGRQLQALARGVDVVVATPGRAIDHINRKTLRLNELETVVLDEADEMLDMGFAEDIDEILRSAPEDRQTVLFSATMPSRIDAIARRHLRNPVKITIGRKTSLPGEAPRVRQCAYVVARASKAAAIGRLLDVEVPKAALIFCRTREQVDQLTETLNGRGYRAEALHGGMSQEQRDRVMKRLRTEVADLLIATDVAARGLDIDHLTHVINYEVPAAPDSYVHRIGRVGRAGREGVAITLIEPREHRMLKTIERVTKQTIHVEKLPTIADVQARRLNLTSAALRECLVGGGLEHFRVVVDTLADEFDIVEVALAAVKLAHESSGLASGEEEIPDSVPLVSSSNGSSGTRFGAKGREGRGRESKSPRGRSEFPRTGAARTGADGDKRRGSSSGPVERIFVGAGRNASVRPQDLVGAIANETSLSGRQIGAIQIVDNFSLVEVPAAAVDEVIVALRKTTIKGHKATVRRDRDGRE